MRKGFGVNGSEGPSLRMDMRPTLTVSQALVGFARTLSLSGTDFERRLLEEADANPALEVGRRDICLSCGRSHGCSCVRRSGSWGAATVGETAEFLTLRDEIKRDVRNEVDRRERVVAEHLIDSLSDRGLLEEDLTDVAERVQCGIDTVRRVMSAIKEVGPPGIGERTVADALINQLLRAPGGGPVRSLAVRVLRDHSDALSSGRIQTIANELLVSEQDVLRAVDYIRTHTRAPASLDEDRAGRYLLPDIIVREGGPDAALEVVLVEMERFEPVALSLCGDAVDARLAAFATEHRTRAESFIRSVHLRWASLLKVARAVVSCQEGFVREGETELKPLSRREVARIAGVHESTVGRAVGNKNVLLPGGRVVPLTDFFRDSAPVKLALKRVISLEAAPLSDGLLAEKLCREGFHISRRTVAKYRAELRIPPHTLRA